MKFPALPTVEPHIAARISTGLAMFAFTFGIVGVLARSVSSSVPVLFFVSMYAIVRSEMIAAQQYRDLADKILNPPEDKVVEAIVEHTDVEST